MLKNILQASCHKNKSIILEIVYYFIEQIILDLLLKRCYSRDA